MQRFEHLVTYEVCIVRLVLYIYIYIYIYIYNYTDALAVLLVHSVHKQCITLWNRLHVISPPVINPAHSLDGYV